MFNKKQHATFNMFNESHVFSKFQVLKHKFTLQKQKKLNKVHTDRMKKEPQTEKEIWSHDAGTRRSNKLQQQNHVLFTHWDVFCVHNVTLSLIPVSLLHVSTTCYLRVKTHDFVAAPCHWDFPCVMTPHVREPLQSLKLGGIYLTTSSGMHTLRCM